DSAAAPGDARGQERPGGAGERSPLLKRLLGCYYVLIPCLSIAFFGRGLLLFLFPNTYDTIDESFEPLKTLKFVHSWGRSFHKWGPMPNLVYAPLYAPFVGYWFWTGELRSPSTDFPYGLQHPFEQEGTLIVVARLAGLLIALAATAYYG